MTPHALIEVYLNSKSITIRDTINTASSRSEGEPAVKQLSGEEGEIYDTVLYAPVRWQCAQCSVQCDRGSGIRRTGSGGRLRRGSTHELHGRRATDCDSREHRGTAVPTPPPNPSSPTNQSTPRPIASWPVDAVNKGTARAPPEPPNCWLALRGAGRLSLSG